MLAGLKQKNVLSLHVTITKDNAQHKLIDLILDHLEKSPEDVATTADVLDAYGCKKEAAMLKCKLVFVFVEYGYCPSLAASPCFVILRGGGQGASSYCPSHALLPVLVW